MHPIERLRYVARAGGEPVGAIAQEAARALVSFSRDPAGLVTACRRLVERAPASGPMWWLASHALGSPDPAAAVWSAAEELDDDPTPRTLARLLPDDATVTVVGWPEQCVGAFSRRGDVLVLAVDGDLPRRLDAVDVAPASTAAAVADSHVVLVDAFALGGAGVLAAAGSYAAAAVARHRGIPVWAVAGVGRVLPSRLFDALVDRLATDDDDPWEREVEVVPPDLIDRVVGPKGDERYDDTLRRADCPLAPELLGPWQ